MTNDIFKFSFKETRKETAGLAVYNSGLQRCEPLHAWGPAVRDHFLIHCVIDGRGTYTTPAGLYELSAGDAFVAYPDTLVQYCADGKEPWEYCWVGFNGVDATRLMSRTEFTPETPVIRDILKRMPCSELIMDIYKSRGTENHSDAAMTGRLYILMSELIRQCPSEKAARAHRRSYYDTAIAYIRANYMTDISVSDIADYVGLSRSQLYRVFKSETGESPIVFLTRYRIHESLSLLMNMGLSVSQVAASVGFSDPLYFSRVFKQYKNISPTRYREDERK